MSGGDGESDMDYMSDIDYDDYYNSGKDKDNKDVYSIIDFQWNSWTREIRFISMSRW